MHCAHCSLAPTNRYRQHNNSWCSLSLFACESVLCHRHRANTWHTTSRIILCMHPANERWRYTVTPSLIGWMHTQNNPCTSIVCRLGTLRSGKWPPYCRKYFQINFLCVWKLYFILFEFPRNVFMSPINNNPASAKGNGLAQNRRQARIWTNYG